MATSTVVLHVGGLHWATSAAAVEATLLRRPGVVAVAANAANQTATVTYDPATTSVAQLSDWVRDCGLHCAGQSVPNHVCDPMAEPAEHEAHGAATPQEMMGHGGHVGMSMDQMVRDMRNRFLVALVLSLPIMLWSPMGRDMWGFSVPAPFGLRDDVFTLLLSLPVVFYSSWIFFDGAWRALRARTLDMMVLVGAGWLYSLGLTLTGGGEVFYEAVLDLAKQIKAAQAPEIEQMQSWLTQWGMPTMPMTPGRDMPGHSGMPTDSVTPGETGTDADDDAGDERNARRAWDGRHDVRGGHGRTAERPGNRGRQAVP